MAEPFQLIGAVAVNVLAQIPLNPQLTFRHISPHMVHLLARMMAKRAVQEQLRSEGVRVSLVKPAEISARAQVYLQSHPEVWREALERAHLLMKQRASARPDRNCAGRSLPDDAFSH